MIDKAAETIIRADLGRLNEIAPGLGDRAIAYVLGELGEVPVSVPPQPLQVGEVLLGYFTKETHARYTMLAAPSTSIDLLLRYGGLLAAVAEHCQDELDFPGSGHVPMALRLAAYAVVHGLPWMMTWEIEEDDADAHTKTGLTPEKALAICEAGGGSLVDLFDILFHENTGWDSCNAADTSDMLLTVVNPETFARDNPEVLLEAADRIDDHGRAAILGRIQAWKLLADADLRDFAFRMAGAPAKDLRDQAVRTLEDLSPDLVLAEAPQRLAARKAGERAAMVGLLGKVGTDAAMDLLRAHRPGEKSAKLAAQIDATLQVADAKSSEADTKPDGPGYRAVDGSWVPIPPESNRIDERAPKLKRLVASLKPDNKRIRDSFSDRNCLSDLYDYDLTSRGPQVLWPIIASNPEVICVMIENARTSEEYQQADRFLQLLPKIPSEIAQYLFDIALGRSVKWIVKRFARSHLASFAGLESQLIDLLTDKRKDTRANAAEWLSERGVIDAIGPIQAALAKEKDEGARTALLLALSRLGADMSAFLGPDAMAKAAEVTLKKAKLAPLDWLLTSGLPALRYRDGVPVPGDVLKAWLATAVQLKLPGGNALLDLYLDQLAPEDAEKLANHIFDAWITYDSEPTSHEAALEAATEQAKQMHAFFQSPFYSRTIEDLIDDYYPDHKRKYPNSGAATKGILALAKRADPLHVATTARAYLKNHGKRVAQATALIDLAAAIDTPETLQVLVAAATRLRQKTVQAHAGALVEAAAQARGWTADELADRTVPTAGLDDTGVLDLPCGAEGRVYRARLADDLTLVLENPEGKTVKALPAGDDDQTKDAKKALSASKKELKQITKQQAERLYEALCAERSWATSDWLADFRGHPVMGRLTDRVIWLGLDEDGTVRASFRPTAEGDYTDAADDPVDPSGFARIRLAHAANLTPETVAAWKQHLKDYEVKPLFTQLDRPFLTVADLSKGATRIDDREGWLTDAKKIQGAGANVGFTPGPVEDSGWFDHYRKVFKGANLIAVIKISGSCLPVQAGASAVLHLEFCPPARHDGLGQPVPLAEVPPILLSECWNDYLEIAAMGTHDPDWGKKVDW